MKPQTKELVEAVTVGGTANAASWALTWQEASFGASIFLSIVTAIWIVVQTGRFIENWREERRLRTRAHIAEAHAEAAKAIAALVAKQSEPKAPDA
jgi:hypothetical protein